MIAYCMRKKGEGGQRTKTKGHGTVLFEKVKQNKTRTKGNKNDTMLDLKE